MAEETMTTESTETTSQAQSSDNFFDAYQLVDDSGQPLDSKSDPNRESRQTATEKSESPAPEQKTVQEQKPTARTTFEKRFFKAGDDGKESFDTDGFVDFMHKRQQPAVARSQFQQQQQPVAPTPPQPPKEPENPYVARVKARQEYRRNLHTPADMMYESYSKARQAGYDEAQAWQYARQQWQAKADEQAALYEAQQEEEWAKKQGESEQEKQRSVEYRSNRMNNELAYAKEFGTVEDFREFVIGKVENGQLVGGYANDVLWAMYHRDNPGTPNPTQEQFVSWYDKFGAHPESMQMLYEVAWARMMSRQWPNVVKRIQSGQQQMQQQQKVSKASKPGSRQNTPVGGDSAQDPLGGFMMPTV